MSIETRTKETGGQSIDLSIDGMSCEACVRRIEKALSAVPGVSGASVDLAGKRAHIVLSEPGTSPDALVAAIVAAGYQASPAD